MAPTETTTRKPKNEGSKRLFKSPVMEALSKTHISLPLIIFFGMSAWLMAYGIQNTDLQVWQIASLFVTGLIFFTWVEYMMHKHIYHMEPDKKWKEELTYKFHGVHHDYPKDKARLALPPTLTVIVVATLFGIFWLILGEFVFAFLPGFLVGYASYLSVHYIVHAFRPPNNIFKTLWVHHGIHHYKHNDRAFGVSSPLWDYIYGTMPDKR